MHWHHCINNDHWLLCLPISIIPLLLFEVVNFSTWLLIALMHHISAHELRFVNFVRVFVRNFSREVWFWGNHSEYYTGMLGKITFEIGCAFYYTQKPYGKSKISIINVPAATYWMKQYNWEVVNIYINVQLFIPMLQYKWQWTFKWYLLPFLNIINLDLVIQNAKTQTTKCTTRHDKFIKYIFYWQ